MSSVFYIKDKPFKICKGSKLCMEPIFLDTETSNNHAVDSHELITWVSSIQVLWGNDYWLMRKPEELCQWYRDEVLDKYGLDSGDEFKPKVVTYCHNLNFDISYLEPYFKEYLPDPDDDSMSIFLGMNDYLTYCQGCLEWRCSYKLANRSLYGWGESLNIPKDKRKKLGTYDYNKIIYQGE